MQHLPAPASDLNGAKVGVNGGRDAYLLLLLGTVCPQYPSAPSASCRFLSPQQEQQKQTHLPLTWCGFFLNLGIILK